ncbi:MAG TPA: TSUP family transporter [Geminicoccaceae bacterium]
MDPLVAIVALGAAAAGFVQGLTGFAYGLVAMAVWAWWLDPVLAGPLVVFGSLVGQLLAIGPIRRGFDARRVLPLIAGGVVGVPVGVA